MIQYTQIKYCPNCASPKITSPTQNSMKCENCGFILFHNTAAATAAILVHKGQIIFVRRGHEPAKGMLDLPGGFVDYNESAEQGILREIKEETGFVVRNLQYFSSLPNHYNFKNVEYHTCDLCFTGEVDDISTYKKSDEVPELVLLHPSKIKIEEIAFTSLQEIIKKFVSEAYAGG